MKQTDAFSTYYSDHLDGSYDCVDRIVLNGYFPLGWQGGGMRFWWRLLNGSDEGLDQNQLHKMAGRFSRRVRGFCAKAGIPIIDCASGVRKSDLAAGFIPSDPEFQGLFLVLVAKAPGLVWKVICNRNGAIHLERKTPWPYVNHYHFHIMDKEWGHLVIKMSGHPPFGIQAMLNGHEWVERQALKQTIDHDMAGNCFVGSSDFQALDQIADTLCSPCAIGRLSGVCDRWVYSSCLCFGLDLEEQERSCFRYQYSCYQLEYSRNLVFTRGTMLDDVFQGLIDRTRRFMDVETLKTIFGRKRRPCYSRRKGTPRLEKILSKHSYNLTVFKFHFERLTLKIYDKGDRVLRVEVIAHNVKSLHCGKGLEKLSIMLGRLQRIAVGFLDVVQAANVSILDERVIDTLREPTLKGSQRLAGVDFQNPRMRMVMEALLSLSPKPYGFTSGELAKKVMVMMKNPHNGYSRRKAAYDLRKLRGKDFVRRLGMSRHYKLTRKGIQTMMALFILREKVIKPVLAGAGKKRRGRPPKNPHPMDDRYVTLQKEMRLLMKDFALVA